MKLSLRSKGEEVTNANLQVENGDLPLDLEGYYRTKCDPVRDAALLPESRS